MKTNCYIFPTHTFLATIAPLKQGPYASNSQSRATCGWRDLFYKIGPCSSGPRNNKD